MVIWCSCMRSILCISGIVIRVMLVWSIEM